MKRREVHEICFECGGLGEVSYQHPLRDEDCPECLGVGKVFVGYEDDTKSDKKR